MRWVLCLLIIGLLAASSQAEPAPLIELHVRGNCDDCYPVGPRFNFGAIGAKPTGGDHSSAQRAKRFRHLPISFPISMRR
jgi:hypothetical protein